MYSTNTFMSFNYRFKYFVALSDFSSKKWPSEEAKDHILFKGLQNLIYLVYEKKYYRGY